MSTCSARSGKLDDVQPPPGDPADDVRHGRVCVRRTPVEGLGFLLKDSAPELLEVVRALHCGYGLEDPQVTTGLIHRFARLSPASATEAQERLTARELEVLRQLAGGLSNAEIATALTIEEGTVKAHVSRVLAKLGVRTRVHAVIYAYEHGLAPRHPNPPAPYLDQAPIRHRTENGAPRPPRRSPAASDDRGRAWPAISRPEPPWPTEQSR
ncbi:response regulator transcription factor [Nonomuraea sp. NPDC050680]|uniref:response regulator transcription factor n=1 Tax=Nonomuraea sp. NPDC050680 TaxID=3154630 RepID=UPI0033C82207